MKILTEKIMTLLTLYMFLMKILLINYKQVNPTQLTVVVYNVNVICYNNRYLRIIYVFKTPYLKILESKLLKVKAF